MVTSPAAFNPYGTTVSTGSFSDPSSYGVVQGQAFPAPNARFNLRGGILAQSEVLPMWGGVALYQQIPSTTNPALGPVVGRAQGLTGSYALSAFSTSDQNFAAVSNPTSPVPTIGSGGQVNLYPLGSGIRLAVACDPALIDLQGGLVSQQISWDFTAQQAVPYVASYPANVLTAATWAAGQVTFTTTSAHGVAVGDDFEITGMIPAGYNGFFTAVAGTTGSTLVANLAVNPGTETVLGTLAAGGGALPVTVLEVFPANCQTVVFNPLTNSASWNYNGACLVIQL